MKLPTTIKTDNLHTLVLLSPSEMAHTVCGVCFSLNKSTSYLSLCLSLNSFCDETSRTWVSLSSETRCVISVGRPWVLAGFESGHMGSSPSLRCTVSVPVLMLTPYGIIIIPWQIRALRDHLTFSVVFTANFISLDNCLHLFQQSNWIFALLN